MKKILISCLLLATPFAVFAQLKVLRNGDVTIGVVTSSKMSKLSVSGPVTTDGVIIPIGKETEGRSTSDVVNPNTLSSIMSMDVITYETPEDTLLAKMQSTRYVLSPDAMKILYPSLVFQSDNGTQGINYTELIPLLVRSIQELKQEIDSLKAFMIFPNSRQTRSGDTSFAAESRFKAALMQNKPNPVKEQTTIDYYLAGDFAEASIRIHDMNGMMVRSYDVIPGTNNITISASELPAGLYLYSLVVDGNLTDTKKMIILK